MRRVTEISFAEKSRIVDGVCAMYDVVQDRLTTEACRQSLELGLFELLHRGAIPVATVLAWARARQPAADAAVRRYAYELWHQRQPLPPDVEAYVMGLVVEPVIPEYSRGHVKTVDTWCRDIGIACMVNLTAKGVGLPPTRSRTASAPSAAFFVAEALSRKGYKLKEQAINRIVWAHGTLPARLEAVMPPSAF